MPFTLVDIIEQALEEIADLEHNGFYVPVASSLVDLYFCSCHKEELVALGLNPLSFTYKELETELKKQVDLNTNAPFVMDWVQSEEDPEDGFYEFQIIKGF